MDAGNHQLSYKLSSILDYFTFDPQKKYFTNSAQKSGAICLSRPRIPARLRVPKSSRTTSPSPHVPASPRPSVPTSPRPRVPKSYVPRPRPTFSDSQNELLWSNEVWKEFLMQIHSVEAKGDLQNMFNLI